MKCCIYELYYGTEFEVSIKEFMEFIDSIKFEDGFRVEYTSDRKENDYQAHLYNITFWVGDDHVGYMYY